MKLETVRLQLIPLNEAHLTDLKEILKDPEIMYAYPHPLSDEEVNEWYRRQQTRYRNDGLGLEAVILKETGEMIGQVGLTMQIANGQSVLEVGYLFKKQYWHQGYATEIAQALVQYAFHELKAKKVHAIINDNNPASQRVAKRLGMQRIQSFTFNDMPHGLWQITRSGK